ncbi:hypothetical protein RFI_26889 [Reticulomyxa filosa]|uniref:Uncharacterized protein n=1 Tax=Reticulomyxa filosa TaxID=46433 RepID=X6M915_RETFI|nr:hypothetical protein RFI_26889 [Reticulomyxa filosa]|eukprot:ETO10488.1 hypothetical protein RFI_26889 [Reticulomyxa filosa]
MSSGRVVVTIDSKDYLVNLSCLTLETLQQQIIEVRKKNQQGKVLIKITDNNGCEIKTDEQLQQIVANDQFHFNAYFKKEMKITNPLVLLTGSMESYLENAKQDLCLLQTLFQSKFGFRVFNTFEMTESLTLNDVISKHCDNYDGLIFVWCGNGNGDALITTENKMKEIQNICSVKPKILINICYDKIQRKVWYKQDEDMFTMSVNTSLGPMVDILEHDNEKIPSYFTQVLCQTIERDINKSFDFIIKQVIDIVFNQEINSIEPIYLIPKINNDENKDNTISINSNNDEIKILNFKKHWNRKWRKANVDASQMVEEMIKKNEEGLVIVANNISNYKNEYSSLITLINTSKIEKREYREYYVYKIKKKLIILDNINIDGNIYAINCKIECKQNVNVTSQLFFTKNCMIDLQSKQNIMLIEWNQKFHYDIPLQLQNFEEKAEECIEKTLFDDAISYLYQHLQISIDKFGSSNNNSNNPYCHPYIAISYNLIGSAYDDKGQYDQAINFYKKSLHILLLLFGIQFSIVAQIYHNLGIAYYYKGQYDVSISFYQKSLNIRNNIFQNLNKDIGGSCWNLGLSFEQKGDIKMAYQYYEKSWKVYHLLYGEWNAETLQAKRKIKNINQTVY